MRISQEWRREGTGETKGGAEILRGEKLVVPAGALPGADTHPAALSSGYVEAACCQKTSSCYNYLTSVLDYYALLASDDALISTAGKA